MTFAPVQLYGCRCRTEPDSTPRSGRVKGRCALESAAARRDRASGLGRYLSVESASCGLGCRASEAIKTCRLDLTDTRIWVSSVYFTIFYFIYLFWWRGLLENILQLSPNLTPSKCLDSSEENLVWIRRLHQKWSSFQMGFWCLLLSGSASLMNVAEACAVAC